MYNNKKKPEIHAIRDNYITEESDLFQAKRSHTNAESLPEISSITRPPMVKQFYSSRLKMWIPWSLHPEFSKSSCPSPQVDEVEEPDPGVDFRPHIFDPVLKQFLLCDSGSMVSAFPPDPGDVPIKNQYLKAANGSKMACFGYKDISIKCASGLHL